MSTYYEGKQLSDHKSAKRIGLQPYLPSEKLVMAVRLAQTLQRPLLVKGEPGCGKSRLAEAIAADLHGERFKEHYFEWNVKSTSKAQEGLYVIDHLERLRNANMGLPTDIILPKNGSGYHNSGTYIELGPIGRAFIKTRAEGKAAPPIVLIDEIDKADIDFPNDLLIEIDRMSFQIPQAKDELGNPVEISADPEHRPIFIITSNDEKPLPPAFLRRCFFHYIDFSEIKLAEIVKARFPEFARADAAVEAFKLWRAKIDEKGTSIKNISTSELLDWVGLIVKLPGEAPAENFIKDNLPVFHQALLKDVESIQTFAQ